MPPTLVQTSADLAPIEPIYRASDEVEDVARDLILRHATSFGFIDSHRLRIAYLLRTDGPPAEATIDTIAKCTKAPALWSFLAEVDFVIWVNEWYWANFPQHREAVVLHELLHVGVSDKGKPEINRHHIEEFIGVAAQYGAWESSRKRFQEALAKHAAEHPSEAEISEAVAAAAEAEGYDVSRREDGTVVIDATRVAELRNRARSARGEQ